MLSLLLADDGRSRSGTARSAVVDIEDTVDDVVVDCIGTLFAIAFLNLAFSTCTRRSDSAAGR
jgi:hypothetical protein